MIYLCYNHLIYVLLFPRKHLNAYKTYHDKLGNTLGTAVNHYNDSTKEFKKIDKDIIRISGTSKLEINSESIEKPQLDN